MSKGTLMLNGVDYSNVGGGGSMVNYSTEEQVIGTWIDGKKLYQKTVNFSHFGGSPYVNNIMNTEGVEIILLQGTTRNLSNNLIMTLPYVYRNSQSITLYVYNNTVVMEGYSIDDGQYSANIQSNTPKPQIKEVING